MTVQLDMTPEQEAGECEILRERIADADREDFLSDEEVGLRFQAMLHRQMN